MRVSEGGHSFVYNMCVLIEFGLNVFAPAPKSFRLGLLELFVVAFSDVKSADERQIMSIVSAFVHECFLCRHMACWSNLQMM